MKKIVITITVVAQFTLVANGQEIKKRTTNLSPFKTEEFHVLKSDKKVKHGPYRITIKHSKVLVEEGFYKLGKKDSLWKRTQDGHIHKIGYYKDDLMHGTWITYGKIYDEKPFLRDSGTYAMGNKTGIWKYNNLDGKPELIYNYDNKEVIFQKRDTLEHLIVVGKDTLVTTLENSPIYLDGGDQFYYTLTTNLRFPNSVFEKTKGIKTKYYISFYVSENGEMEEIRSLGRENVDLTQLAITALEATRKSKWLPGRYQGKPVRTQVIIPFEFTNKGILPR